MLLAYLVDRLHLVDNVLAPPEQARLHKSPGTITDLPIQDSMLLGISSGYQLWHTPLKSIAQKNVKGSLQFTSLGANARVLFETAVGVVPPCDWRCCFGPLARKLCIAQCSTVQYSAVQESKLAHKQCRTLRCCAVKCHAVRYSPVM